MAINLANRKKYSELIELIQQELERESIVPLKRISNDIVGFCINKSDFSWLYLSVVTYVIYKTLSQNHIVTNKTWRNRKESILTFLDSIKGLEKEEIAKLNLRFITLFQNSDSELYNYFKNIEKKARLKVAARIYSSGYSTKKVNELINVDQMALQNYLSNAQIHNKAEYLIRKKVSYLMSEKRDLIFDSSALISLGNTGLITFFEKFKEKNPKINLYITEDVYNETIGIKEKVIRFGWLAIQYENLIAKGIIKIIKNLEINSKEIEDVSNSIFSTRHGKLEILQAGELQSVAYALANNCVLVIDEIVTRWLIDSPSKLHDLMESRYKQKVFYDKFKLNNVSKKLSNLLVIRSVDFIAFGIEKGYFSHYKGLDFKKPLLYSLKYSGCATTYEEIDDYIAKNR